MSSRIASRILLVSCVLALGSTLNKSGNALSQQLGGSPGKVQVKNCVKVLIASEKPAFSVTYDYAFPGRNSVHIDALGNVPATGSFHYLSLDNKLEFKDSSSGAVLLRVPLEETIVVAAGTPLNYVPGENEFQRAFRSFTWTSQNNLQVRANAVLGKYFRYLPREDRQTTLISTTFTPLPLNGARKGVLGQVALLMSFPFDAKSGQFSFHIQTIVREGRALSDEYRETNDPMILKTADSFVDNIVAEMSR